jgi:glycosyltransferase involved in cell wall biosynthesis
MAIHNKMKPLKLLHVVGDSRWGGAAPIILGLGHTAEAQGWKVDILTTDPRFQQAVRDHGLGLVNMDVIRREIRPLWDIGGLLRLYNFIRREGYRIVHTHTSKGGFIGRLAATLAGVPVIVHTAHGFAFHEGSPASIRRFYCVLERIASGWCDRIVTVSEFHKRWALQLRMCDPAKVLAIPNGVAGLKRSPRTSIPDLRRQLGAGDEGLLALTTARLAPDKGFQYLMDAIAALPRTGRQLRFLIAGDGPARADVEKMARDRGVADRVSFLGHRNDIGDLLAACDLWLLPSLREGLSMALLEAMAAGKPIIATSLGSQAELAAQIDMARLVPPGDAHALNQAIQEFVLDPAAMAQRGTNARTLFECRYTEDRMLNSYRSLYFELLAEKCGMQGMTPWRGSGARFDEAPEWMQCPSLETAHHPHQRKGGGV